VQSRWVQDELVAVTDHPHAEVTHGREQPVGHRRVDDMDIAQRIDPGSAHRVRAHRAGPGEGGKRRSRRDQGDAAHGRVREGGCASGSKVGTGTSMREPRQVERLDRRAQPAVGVVECVVRRRGHDVHA
jgi:hypothetical protein